MVEQLTEKNLSLGEKIQELKEANAHYESLITLNEDIEFEHIELEKQLQRIGFVFRLYKYR